MVTRFDVKYHNFKESLKGMEKSINSDNDSEVYIKAALYDFSACIEQLWKLMKYILEYVHGIEKINGSKDAFRAFMSSGYIEKQQVKLLFEMYELRNRLAHDYDTTNFSYYFSKLKNYCEVLDQIDCKILEIKNHYSEEFDDDCIEVL